MEKKILLRTNNWLFLYNQLALHSTMDNQLMKKWINVVKIKFHINENMKWHCLKLELDWIWNLIQLKLNWIQIEWDAHWCKRYWKSALDYGVEKKYSKKNTNPKRRRSMNSSWFENWLNIFQFGIVIQPFELNSFFVLYIGEGVLLWASLDQLGYDPQIRGSLGE
jgi:hypothetical protein